MAESAVHLCLDRRSRRHFGQSTPTTGGARAGPVPGPADVPLRRAAGIPLHRTDRIGGSGDWQVGVTLSEDHPKLLGGLFHGYDVAGLPRTNNDLEHLFGRLRHQERRITGRKVATPGLIIRGPVRVLSAVLSWLQPVSPAQLGQVDPAVWREERRQLGKLRQARVLQRRFRQHPQRYLATLEERLVKLSLPP